MVSEEHQKLVNALARELEKQNIKIVQIDMRGTLELFDPKYRDLPKPGEHGGRVPDLVGQGTSGTIHLGEAETDMDSENLDAQLMAFSGKVTMSAGIPVPLHVAVPQRIWQDMRNRIRYLGLGSLLDSGRIVVWQFNS